MKDVPTRVCFLLMFLFCSCWQVHSLSYGSNTDVSRFTHVTFPRSDTDNTMLGFGAFEGGFSLQDSETTCTFNSYFPISGTIDMKGGTLHLLKDLEFDSYATIENLGYFSGNGHTLRFPDAIDEIPAMSADAFVLTSLDTEVLTNDVLDADWSYDDQYVVCGDNDDLLTAFSFDGSELTYVTSIDATDAAVSVRAHPSSYYFAVGIGKLGGDELRIYSFSGSAFTLADSVAIGSAVNSVAWSHDGNYLAISYDQDVEVYSFSAGTLTLVDSLAYGADDAMERALCWDQTAEYFAIGTEDSVRVFYFDGATVTVTVRDIVAGGTNIAGLDWSKTDDSIAIVHSAATDNLCFYEFDSSVESFGLTFKACETIPGNGVSVHVNSSLSRTSAGVLATGAGGEFLVHKWISDDLDFELEYEIEKGTGVNVVRWSNDGAYLLSGDKLDDLIVYGADLEIIDSIIIDQTDIYLNNNCSWKLSTTIQGESSLDAGGRRIVFRDSGSILVGSGSMLRIQNAEIAGLQGSKLSCYDDTASIYLENCILCMCNDFVFSKGSLTFENEVLLSGTNQFTYSSVMTSTINMLTNLRVTQGATFYYAPESNNRDLLYMTDKSSVLHLGSCTLKSTTTGIRLTRGQLYLDNKVTFSSASTVTSELICLGDGTADNDIDVTFLGANELEVFEGVRYANVG